MKQTKDVMRAEPLVRDTAPASEQEPEAEANISQKATAVKQVPLCANFELLQHLTRRASQGKCSILFC